LQQRATDLEIDRASGGVSQATLRFTSAIRIARIVHEGQDFTDRSTVQSGRAAEQGDRGAIEAGDATVERRRDNRRADRREQRAVACFFRAQGFGRQAGGPIEVDQSGSVLLPGWGVRGQSGTGDQPSRGCGLVRHVWSPLPIYSRVSAWA